MQALRPDGDARQTPRDARSVPVSAFMSIALHTTIQGFLAEARTHGIGT